VEGVAGLESTVSASSSTLLADMGDAEKLSAAVTEAETSVVVEIPKSPPPPFPPPPPSPPPSFNSTTTFDDGTSSVSGASGFGARARRRAFYFATLAATYALVVS
jgi:hypothetical protein